MYVARCCTGAILWRNAVNASAGRCRCVKVRRHARDVRRLIGGSGGSHVRVFGSAATGTDHEGSDIDLLFDMGTPMGLMEIGALERSLSELLGAPVDLVPSTALRPDLRDRVLAEAGH
jgi:predicted nucleotidyltransferase